MNPLIHILILNLVFIASAFASGTIKGHVKNSHGIPQKGVKICLGYHCKLSAETDSLGKFEFSKLNKGYYHLHISHLGFKKTRSIIHVADDQVTTVELNLEEDVYHTEEVVVIKKKESQEIKETGFNVNSIEMKTIQNQNMDINKVLNQTNGIRIREQGGLGADFNFSLNGFSGSQVKFFIDGVPMDNFGSSLTLNNIPVNLISRVDVYKGVVPVHLGADALGGAINVVTNQKTKQFLDASYSLGSFNTHRATLMGRYTFDSIGVCINARALFNYADNNYLTRVQVANPLTGKIDQYEEVERFHDGYQSRTAAVEIGLIDKQWADHIDVGFIASDNYKEVQQGYNMTKPAGEVFTSDQVYIPSVRYAKNDFIFNRLAVNAYVNYIYKEAQVTDTSSKIYDWRGNYTTKLFGYSGELNWAKTQFYFKDKCWSSAVNMQYELHPHHVLKLNNTFTNMNRVGIDPISKNPVPFSNPNELKKNITGVAVDSRFLNDKLKTSIFYKSFLMATTTYEANDDANGLDQFSKSFTQSGFGFASSYMISKWLLAKASMENTYRLPESYELFGNGLLLESSADLNPEKSLNFNLGTLIQLKYQLHTIQTEVNYLYRLPQNLIRLASTGITGKYENLSSAEVNCIEMAIKYNYNKIFTFDINGTYQNLINTNQYESNGAISVLYLDRLPNIPFLFANAIGGITYPNLFQKNTKVSLNFTTHFVESFYLKWPSQGSRKDKYDIPRQIYHDVYLSYSFQNERYNLSLSCNNINDSILYDDFMLQKPRRSFSMKLRFYI